MSKSIGNVVSPFDLIDKYGVDPVRYYFLREIPTTGDGDYSEARFKDRYNDDLANGLGNLAARVAKLCQKSGVEYTSTPEPFTDQDHFDQYIANFELNKALEYIWEKIRQADQYVNQEHPWTLEGQALSTVLQQLVGTIINVSLLLEPFLPDTSAKLLAQFQAGHIEPAEALFPRLT
jgi:methionyl-tRNA synthetase